MLVAQGIPKQEALNLTMPRLHSVVLIEKLPWHYRKWTTGNRYTLADDKWLFKLVEHFILAVPKKGFDAPSLMIEFTRIRFTTYT